MTKETLPAVSELPHDRSGCIIGVHLVARYPVGPLRYRVYVGADHHGSVLPLYTVTESLAPNLPFVAVGAQMTFPSAEDCVHMNRQLRR